MDIYMNIYMLIYAVHRSQRDMIQSSIIFIILVSYQTNTQVRNHVLNINM